MKKSAANFRKTAIAELVQLLRVKFKICETPYKPSKCNFCVFDNKPFFSRHLDGFMAYALDPSHLHFHGTAINKHVKQQTTHKQPKQSVHNIPVHGHMCWRVRSSFFPNQSELGYSIARKPMLTVSVCRKFSRDWLDKMG